MMLDRARTAWHTLRHLGPLQLLYWIWRRAVQPRLEPPPPSPAAATFPNPVGFRFLNRTVSFAAGELDWMPREESRLWVYHLHYFGYLRDESRTEAEECALVHHWIRANSAGFGPGWEPYPCSLRLVNWCRWVLDGPGDSGRMLTDQTVLDSMAQQANWLNLHLEKHILANHYFENLKALVFAGVVLEQPSLSGWLERSQSALAAQLGEQFLDDGGHYERSPSYHCLLVDGLLDLLELDQWRPGKLARALVRLVRERTGCGIELLAGIEMPGDRYPLFNDSAFDSAPLPSQIYARARQLGVSWKPAAVNRKIEYPDFGIYGLHTGTGDALAIKCGAVGPDYQPGHTHCDLLSFEWYVDGRPVVVDTGVYEYEPGAMRRYVRSTAAHNTVSVDDAEQSEIWGEFRVGRRARVIAAHIERLQDGISFDGQIDAFPQVGRIRHRRQINCHNNATAAQLAVTDTIQGRGHRTLRSRVLFHPDIEVIQQADREWTLYRNGQAMGALTTGEDLDVEIATAPYCPEFGLRLAAQQVILHRTASLPARLCYSLRIDRTAPSTIIMNS